MIGLIKHLSLFLILCSLFSIISCSYKTAESENFSENNAKVQKHINQELWIEENTLLEDYEYSFAIIGDTQKITRYYPDKLSCIYDWIVKNAKAKKIKCVIGLGDITDSDTVNEWELAKSQIEKLSGIVPYTLVRGNHDSVAAFNNTFGVNSSYLKEISGSYDKKVSNTYKIFSAGNNDYLILNLDFALDENVLLWADEIIKTHPNHNIIITIHAYLTRDGTTLDSKDADTPTDYGAIYSSEDLWNKLISKHKNIVMVFSGHISTDGIIFSTNKGINGNTVNQFLIDPQGLDINKNIGATGLIAMLYFSKNNKVQVEYYSSIKNLYYMKKNQFTFEFNAIEPTYGDVNDDAKVDIKDLIRLKKYLKNVAIEINLRTADFNFDETVDFSDIKGIRYKIINSEV